MCNFYSKEELLSIGFKNVGDEVFISRKASIYGARNISIGSHVRIDDFCILSGKVEINNYIHIAAYSALYGGEKGIYIQDFANISSRVTIYGVSDDYSGSTMTNPLIPDEYKAIDSREVIIKRHVIVGSTSVILPGSILEEGCAFGAMSFVKNSTDAWGIYAGIPVKRVGERKRDLLDYEKAFLSNTL